jgi:DNA-binding response OmpR family regulator
MRILLVEDDPMIGKTLQQALQQDGYAVDWVTDGEAGRVAIATSQDAYVLVLLDLGLPRKGGLALLRELRREGNRSSAGRHGATPSPTASGPTPAPTTSDGRSA